MLRSRDLSQIRTAIRAPHPSTPTRTNLIRDVPNPILQVQRILRLVGKVQVQVWRWNIRSRGAVFVAQAVVEHG